MPQTCNTNTEQLTIRERLRTWTFWKPVLFVMIGGAGGFLYYRFVGCASGTCAITSNPYASIAFGGFLGYFIVNRPCAC